MGRLSLKQKLQQLFDVGIRTEAEVVYALVETRKLLEIQQQSDAYPALAFHCDWALHSHMDRRPARLMLKTFDDYCDKCIAGTDTKDDWKAISATLHASQFRDELEQFLTSLKIKPNLDLRRWFQFLHLCSLVIEDTPLKIKRPVKTVADGQASITIKHLKAVVVKARRDGHMSHLNWKIYYAQRPPPKLSPAELSIGFGITTAAEPLQPTC